MIQHFPKPTTQMTRKYDVGKSIYDKHFTVYAQIY